jgi:hypothetical protein
MNSVEADPRVEAGAAYPSKVTEDDGGTGVWDRSSPRRHVRRPDLAPRMTAMSRLSTKTTGLSMIHPLTLRLRESLKESEADIDSETANGERRSARDRYTARPERA